MTDKEHADDERLIAPDLVLLLLIAEGSSKASPNRINGITRLEKLLFLAQKETDVTRGLTEGFDFHAYDYGPYSKAVYEAVELLEQAGLLHEDRAYQGQSLDEMEESAAGLDEREGVERRFSLTEHGVAVAKLLARKNPAVAAALGAIKSRYANLPLRRLISYVYATYPEYAEASKIRGQFR